MDTRTILHLTFDEGRGAQTADRSGSLPDGRIEYRYLNAAYTESMPPQWRKRGVHGGCLLFDGSSTAVVFPAGAAALGGGTLTIGAWIAPRAFEWIKADTAGRDDAPLTAVVCQYDPREKRGLLLGLHRFGRLCFRWGDGLRWRAVWTESARLQSRAWNHVAAVFDAGAGRVLLYLNGERVGARELPAGAKIAPASGEALTIGADPHAEAIPAGRFHYFAGLMDEVRVEARAVPEAQIARWASAFVPAIDDADIGLENLLTKDVYKTQYHGGPWQHWMNEPHAPVYYRGAYHLFFQSNSFGPYWRGISWGHLVSADTVRWRPVRDAIVPREGGVCPDGVWSGGATLDANGVPVLFFTAADEGFAGKGLISNQNISVAWPADLNDPDLKDWNVSDRLALAQRPGEGRPGEFRDAHVWREDGVWRMVVCTGSTRTTGGAALLFETDRLEVRGEGVDMNWRCRGPVWELPDPEPKFGTSWEMPILIPLRTPDGTRTRHAFFFMPAPTPAADNKVYYFVGDFDRARGRFIPDAGFCGAPRLLDYGENVFTGASALEDVQTGRTCLFSIMQGQRSGAEEGAAGWAHCVGLTRNLCLNADASDVCVRPDPRLYALLGERLLSLCDADAAAANRALARVRGDRLWLRTIVEPEPCARFGLKVRADAAGDGPAFCCDCCEGTLTGLRRGGFAGPRAVHGPLSLKDGRLTMEIFIDRSLVEGFFNGEKALSLRDYGDPSAQRLAFFSDGALRVIALEVRRVGSIYE